MIRCPVCKQEIYNLNFKAEVEGNFLVSNELNKWNIDSNKLTNLKFFCPVCKIFLTSNKDKASKLMQTKRSTSNNRLK